eukprot:jgi/Ulvmu1/6866/UM031_0071.1
MFAPVQNTLPCHGSRAIHYKREIPTAGAYHWQEPAWAQAGNSNPARPTWCLHEAEMQYPDLASSLAPFELCLEGLATSRLRDLLSTLVEDAELVTLASHTNSSSSGRTYS